MPAKAGRDPYVHGYQDGRREAREEYERTLAVLREENSTMRRLVETTAKQRDEATTELIRGLAGLAAPAPPMSTAYPMQPMSKGRTSKDPIAGLGNLLDPVPFEHPEAQFANATAASLMATSDGGDGAEADAA